MRLKLIISIIWFITSKLVAQEIDLKQNDLLNGPLYYEQKSNIQGDPFLLGNSYHLSKILYKKVVYNDLLIKYDVYNQRIIYFQELVDNLPRFILLNLNYLEEFEISDKQGKMLFTKRFNHLDDLMPKIKYYQLIYDGKLKYVKGTLKVIDQSTRAKSTDKYTKKTYYYIIIENYAHRVRSRRDILGLFKNHKKELRQYIKKSGLSIKTESHQDIETLLVYCESLVER